MTVRRLTRPQRGILAHALGLDSSRDAFRNHLAIALGSPDHRAIQSLLAAGLMVEGEPIPGGLRYYHVTEVGREAIGAPAALYPEDIYQQATDRKAVNP